MRQKVPLFTSLLVILALFTGCGGPSIGLKTDFQQANFQINKSRKSDIVNRLGLPQQSLHDNEGREHYLYEGSTHLLGACIGCGNVNGSVGLIPSLMNQASIKDGAEFVFDKDEMLVAQYFAAK